MVLCEQEYTASFGVLRDLWRDGVALKSGGAISGVLANGSVAVFSKVASLILFTGLFVALSMIALRLTLGTIAGWRQNLPAYEEEPEKPAKQSQDAKPASHGVSVPNPAMFYP